MPYITIKAGTVEEQTRRRARQIASGAASAVRSSLDHLESLAEDRGGRQAFAGELGDDTQDLLAFVRASKTYLKAVSDLSDADLTQIESDARP